MYLNQKITGLLQDALLECKALFDEEYEGELDTDSDETGAVLLEEDGTTTVERLRWG
jgi:hypothetical protein